MTLKGQLRRLERGLRGTLESFVLEDGSRYYFDPMSGDCFLHGMECLRVQGEGKPFPEPPETIKAIARARDRRAALNQLYPNGAALSAFPYEEQALVERGELVPLKGEPVEDLSE